MANTRYTKIDFNTKYIVCKISKIERYWLKEAHIQILYLLSKTEVILFKLARRLEWLKEPNNIEKPNKHSSIDFTENSVIFTRPYNRQYTQYILYKCWTCYNLSPNILVKKRCLAYIDIISSLSTHVKHLKLQIWSCYLIHKKLLVLTVFQQKSFRY